MICIPVTPQSRKLAKVDLLNAAARCDIVELCLDHFLKEPNIKELLEDVEKPVILSCRRKSEGGAWEGSEEDRLKHLRAGIISGPAYVELELDIADQIPRFGETKRVISCRPTLDELKKKDILFKKAKQAKADVIKIIYPTPTLDAAWMLLAIMHTPSDLPIVGQGLGPSSTMLSLLSRKYGAPWIYAALEKGMESYVGQATVFELDELHRWRAIDKSTRFVGIIGYQPHHYPILRSLNAAFDDHQLSIRCLPILYGKTDHLRKRLENLKVNAALVDQHASSELLNLVDKKEPAVEDLQQTDLVINQNGNWTAYNLLMRSVARGLEEFYQEQGKMNQGRSPLAHRNVLIIGCNSTAQIVARALTKHEAIISIASPDDKTAQKVSQKLNVRHIPYATIYDNIAEMVVYADPQIKPGHHRTEINPAILREGMGFLDVSQLPTYSSLGEEASYRGCTMIDPALIGFHQLAGIFKILTEQELPKDQFLHAVSEKPR